MHVASHESGEPERHDPVCVDLQIRRRLGSPCPVVGHDQSVTGIGQLRQDPPIDIELLAEPLQRVLDRAVDQRRVEVYELSREIGNERLELDARFGRQANRIVRAGHGARSYALRTPSDRLRVQLR